jgi:hypothetical protein
MLRQKKSKHFLEQKVIRLQHDMQSVVLRLIIPSVQEALQLAASIAGVQEDKALSKAKKHHQTQVGSENLASRTV